MPVPVDGNATTPSLPASNENVPNNDPMVVENSTESTTEIPNKKNGNDQNPAAAEHTAPADSPEATEDDNVSLTSTDSMNDEDSDVDDPPSKRDEDPELLLLKANALKEEGNNYFKEKEYEKASRSYRRGTNTLKPLNKGNTGDEQVKALLVSLQTNLSMMCLKIGKHKQSAQVASAALKIDSSNVKALFRRAVACRQMGNFDDAKADLKQALQLDPTNAAVKKELAALKKAIENAKNEQKKGLQKAFSKGGGLLYDDKEEEKRKREEQARLEKKREEELLKKRKAQWEDECVKRMAKGEEALSFEEWDKERIKKEKAEEKRKKEERRKAREAAKAAKSEDSDDDSGDELTEKELALLKGYKKTSDGRVTSYFTREQSAHEKELIGDIAPKRLEPSTVSNSPVNTPAENGKGNPSAWNQAGTTWEEKDTSEWCRDCLKSRLMETKTESNGLVCLVTKVDTITGDASVAIASGKKRYIFDFHCSVDFEVREADSEELLASGSLKLPDICSTHHHELEVQFGGWKKTSPKEHREKAAKCHDALVSQVRSSVKLFVDDFNTTY